MKKILLLLAIHAIVFCSYAQELPPFVKDSLDTYVNRALTEWQIPGVSVAVVKDGKVIYMKGYGVREAGTNDMVDENTLFMIGSNTKAFTGMALAMLHAEKKLSLDDKVIKWLPSFKLYDPWVTKEANLRDLLCHRLGFETFQGDFMYFDTDLTAKEVLEKLAQVKPMYGFRSKWGYTNAAFGVAGEVLNAASGKTWAEFIDQRIFTELGMDRSLALSKDIKNASNRALAHTVDRGVLKKINYGNIDNIAPAGSISSSASDMTKWAITLLNSGKSGDKQVIPTSAINQAFSPHSILGNGGTRYNTGHFALYGLGWFLHEYNGKKIVEHTGGVNGFVTAFTLVPEEKLGIIVFTNTDANNFYEALKQELVDAFLGLPYRNYSKTMLAEHSGFLKERERQHQLLRDTINLKPATALPLAAYAGSYKHEVYGNMTILLEKGELTMLFEHHPGRFSKLEPIGGNRFLSTWNDPLYGVKVLPFTVENGKVKSVTVRVADFVEFTPYEFVKVK